MTLIFIGIALFATKYWYEVTAYKREIKRKKYHSRNLEQLIKSPKKHF